MYKLAATDLSTMYFTPLRQDNSDVALTGFLDAPARLGDTYYSWASEDGFEPYVSAADIASGGFGGRDLSLIGVVQGASESETRNRVEAIHKLIDGFSDLVPLVTDYGTFQVYVNGMIAGDYLSEKGIKVTIPMREPVVNMSGTVPKGNGAAVGIDGISFEQLGGACLYLNGDKYSRAAPKSADITAYGKEAYAIARKEASVLDLRMAIRTNTYPELKTKVTSLMALFNSPGMRAVTAPGDKTRSVFAKDGFSVSMIHLTGEFCACVIDCKLIEKR